MIGYICFLKLNTDRPDCIDGRISFNFFSHLKNVKEVYITSEMDRKTKAVKGQVLSFIIRPWPVCPQNPIGVYVRLILN